MRAAVTRRERLGVAEGGGRRRRLPLYGRVTDDYQEKGTVSGSHPRLRHHTEDDWEKAVWLGGQCALTRLLAAFEGHLFMSVCEWMPRRSSFSPRGST